VRFGRSKGRHVHVLSATTLTVVAPPHHSGTVNVRVTTRCGTSATRRADRYRYVDRPVITAVAPASGRTAGGTRVRIRGSRFEHVRAVLFGSARGTHITVTSSGRLYVTAPAHAAGSVDVRVVTAYGTSAGVLADHYRYVGAPTITGMSPTGGLPLGGTPVTIDGSNFVGTLKVSFGTVPASSVQRVSENRLTATPPAHDYGTVDVRVSTTYGTSAVSAADRYTYRDAPEPVSGLTVQDTTATSATLRWTVPSGVAGVLIRRATGDSAPADPSSGTLVARLTPSVTAFVDTGLAKRTTYSYAVFTYSAEGPLYSSLATTAVTTPANSRPDAPTVLSVSPSPVDGNVCSSAPYTWLGSLGGRNLTLGAHVSDPDGGTQLISAHFHLWDLGGTGTDALADVVGPDDVAGQSGHVTGDGGFVIAVVDGALLTDGHLYGFDATADDGTARSAASSPCHFWYDASPPQQVQVGAPDSFAVGTAAQFDLSASETSPADGNSSGIDHFAYAFSSAADLSGNGGTHLAAATVGSDASASFTYTPSGWGPQTLHVIAVDQAGNHSAVTTYNFYVPG
jgi:hypothetical protein